jgi:hypothetical protein
MSFQFPTKPGRLLSRSAFEPFKQDFLIKINDILKANNSKWNLHDLWIDTRDKMMLVMASFHTVDALWVSRAYIMKYDGTLLETREDALAFGRTYPFNDDFFVSFDLDPYFKEFLEMVVIETQKKRTARIVSKRIQKELVAAAWHPRRVERWLEAGLQLEDL